MMIVVTYDVNTETPEGQKRLRRVAQQCGEYGPRVQKSVFECQVDPVHFTLFRKRLEALIDPGLDSIRYYYLGSIRQPQVEHVGAKTAYDSEGVLTFSAHSEHP